MNVRRISRNNKKEKQEGKTYESNIGLSLDKESALQSTSGVHKAEVYHLPTVPEETFRDYKNAVSQFTPRPTCPNNIYDDKLLYNIILFDTETNATGKAAELCQLSAVDKSGHCCFAVYILPTNSTDRYASN